MLEENFWRQHSKILGQTLRKHLESISEVTKCRKKNHEKKVHLLSPAPELDEIKGEF